MFIFNRMGKILGARSWRWRVAENMCKMQRSSCLLNSQREEKVVLLNFNRVELRQPQLCVFAISLSVRDICHCQASLVGLRTCVGVLLAACEFCHIWRDCSEWRLLSQRSLCHRLCHSSWGQAAPHVARKYFRLPINLVNMSSADTYPPMLISSLQNFDFENNTMDSSSLRFHLCFFFLLLMWIHMTHALTIITTQLKSWLHQLLVTDK